MSNNHIFWIASYPKSGNTLLRSILVSLFFTNNGIFKLKMLQYINQFEKTKLIYDNKKIFKNDFNKIADIATFYKYLLKIQEKEILNFSEDFKFYKSHSGNFVIGGNNFTKKENTRGFIYMIRDPRDICISLSKHLNITIDESINYMINDLQSLHWKESRKNVLFKEESRPSLFLSSWANHVNSWSLTDWNVPKLFIKFEDLVYDKKNTVKKIVNFFSNKYGFKFNNIEEKVDNIIKTTEFEKFKNEEKNYGFDEAVSHNSFFSVGKKEQWIKILKNNQIKKIEKNFGKIMHKYGYQINS